MKKRVLGSDNFVEKIKGYEKLKMTYNPPEFKPIINGKKVRFWKCVKISDTDMNHNEFIPIYFKGYHKGGTIWDLILGKATFRKYR